MPPPLLTQLIALLARWDDLAADSAQRLKSERNPTVGGFYTGVMYGAEVARDELAAIVAEALAATVEQRDD